MYKARTSSEIVEGIVGVGNVYHSSREEVIRIGGIQRSRELDGQGMSELFVYLLKR